MPRELVVVAQFDPPGAQSQFDAWRAKNADLFAQIADDDIRIDIGRAESGDFVRVWLPINDAHRVVK